MKLKVSCCLEDLRRNKIFEVPYYHAVIKKTIIGFGALFSKIKIERFDSTDNVLQVVAVPITYGPKEKVFVRLRQDPNLTNHTYVNLPMLAFEITGYNYDSERAMNKNNKIYCYKDGQIVSVHTAVPYNLNIDLHLISKGTEDSLTVIEQILPLFKPQYTMTLSVLPELNVVQDIPIDLNGVSVMDDYEGDFSTRRLVTHTFSFTAKVNLFGPVTSSGAITRTDTDIETFENKVITSHVSTGDLSTGEITSDFWN